MTNIEAFSVTKRPGNEITGEATINYTGNIPFGLVVTIAISKDGRWEAIIFQEQRIWNINETATVSDTVVIPDDFHLGTYDAICNVMRADNLNLVAQTTLTNKITIESYEQVNKLLNYIIDNFHATPSGCLAYLDLNNDNIINVLDLATAAKMTESECKEVNDTYEGCLIPEPGDWTWKFSNYTETGGNIVIVRDGEYINMWTEGDWDIAVPSSNPRRYYVGGENYRFYQILYGQAPQLFERYGDAEFALPAKTNIEIHTRFA